MQQICNRSLVRLGNVVIVSISGSSISKFKNKKQVCTPPAHEY